MNCTIRRLADPPLPAGGAGVRRCCGWLALLLLLSAGTAARADLVVFNLGNPNIAGNTGVSSPYATLTITGNASTGVVDFAVTLAGANQGSFGEFGFDYNHGNVSAGDFTASITGTGGNTSSWGLQGSGQMDGFGTFDEVFGPSNNAASARLTSFDIKLQFAAGKFGEAQVSNFEVLNAGGANGPGFYFAEHFFPASGQTGYIGVNTLPQAAPAPRSFVLFGIGAVGLAGYGWRRWKPAATGTGRPIDQPWAH
jgi:hypothetical protein